MKTILIALSMSAAGFAGLVQDVRSSIAAGDYTNGERQIAEYRKANGVFKSAEELAMVKGIGLKTVEKTRDRIELGRTAPAQKPVAPSTTTAAKAKPVARR